jgi:predicted transposase YbfD/YdcC
MAKRIRVRLVEHFAALEDPRRDRTKEHLLIDIVTIAVCAVICGADDWVEVAAFGRGKEKWLRQFLQLPHGIPSHETFWRVFRALDPHQFEQCFLAWVQSLMRLTDGEIVAVDGKTLRRSYDRLDHKAAIHMVSAWATANQVVLGQRKVKYKSNEIKAIPELLRLLDLHGCIVTVDALGCQQAVAAAIRAQGADYVLAVKGNQGHLLEDLKELFTEAEAVHWRDAPHDYVRAVSGDHGRIEIRECWTISQADYVQYLRKHEAWPDLRSLVRVRCERRTGRKRSREIRYYITSLANEAGRILNAVRGHWGIENGLHWVLDIAFGEDQSRLRKGAGPENFAVLRHMAVSLLKQEPTEKIGVKAKRLRAAVDEQYLLKVLTG